MEICHKGRFIFFLHVLSMHVYIQLYQSVSFGRLNYIKFSGFYQYKYNYISLFPLNVMLDSDYIVSELIALFYSIYLNLNVLSSGTKHCLSGETCLYQTVVSVS